MKEIERIAVIGAGLAGLSCARHLQQQGLEVQLFEKSRGAAGRSTSRGCDYSSPICFRKSVASVQFGSSMSALRPHSTAFWRSPRRSAM